MPVDLPAGVKLARLIQEQGQGFDGINGEPALLKFCGVSADTSADIQNPGGGCRKVRQEWGV